MFLRKSEDIAEQHENKYGGESPQCDLNMSGTPHNHVFEGISYKTGDNDSIAKSNTDRPSVNK